MIIAASIDLTKIDKARIVEGKNGQKYYNITVRVNDEKDQYDNDAAITEGQTKEEREAKAKPKYLGNGRIVWQSGPATPAVAAPVAAAPEGEDDGLPF